LVLAAVAVPAAFGAGDASAQNRCPYIQPHEDAIARARSLKSQRASTNDVPTLCQLLPQLAAVHDELASNLEMAANHPGCREQGGGANASALRQYAQENRQAAAQCSAALDADPARRSSGGCGSDITGTKGGSPAPRGKCESARQMRVEARKMARSEPTVAKRVYREAADEYVAAGDFNLAMVVMRELAALDSPSASSSGGSAIGGRAPSPFRMWQPTKDNPDCGNANATEIATAGYYNTCVAPEAAKGVKRYQHPISSQTLFERARAKCGSASRENHDCYVDAKVAYLLANDPVIRRRCEVDRDEPPSQLRNDLAARLGRTVNYEERKKNAVIACVDSMYLYGPDGPPSLRDQMKERLNRGGVKVTAADPDYATSPPPAGAASCRPGAGWAPYPCCQAGFGMKPTPGGFGSWSCQQLGAFSMRTAKDLEEAERRFDETAALAVAAADRNLSQQIDEAVREKCAVAALLAARSVMKGGQPLIPDRCRAFSDAARAELAYYADRHVNQGDAAVEELLAYLPRGNLGPPQAGVQDLTPDQRQVRVMECIWRGGAPENCAAGAASGGQSAPPPAARTFVRGGISP
jgi:hypothetical protein